MEGVNKALREELLGRYPGFYNVMAALRGPDFAPANELEWAFTAFVRACVFAESLEGLISLRHKRLSQADVSRLIAELQLLLRRVVEHILIRVDIWKGIEHYLVHVEHALAVLARRTSLSEKKKQEAKALGDLLAIIKLRFERVCGGKESLNYALPALEDTVLAWYGLYCKD